MKPSAAAGQADGQTASDRADDRNYGPGAAATEAAAGSAHPLHVPPVIPPIDSDQSLRQAMAALPPAGTRVAADTERASGFRYSQQAYLIQLRTPAAGIWLIDPVGVTPSAFAELDSALSQGDWVLHAASQDLPALRQAGLHPQRIFDTELAARLLGRDHVGLGPLTDDVLGINLAKDHGNSDWSVRPLPDAWLSYAAGDVEFLFELADALREELVEAGKLEWAEQEFAHVLTQAPPAPKPDPWRSTADIHTVRSRRSLALVRQLWQVRESLAEKLDLSPHRLINDRAIVALANRSEDDSLRGARQGLTRKDWRRHPIVDHIEDFQAAVDLVARLDESDLPPLKPPRRGLPAPGLWKQKKPEAARRWLSVRPAIKALAEAHHLPTENLISPKPLRALLWEPAGTDPASVDRQLADSEVRPWQRALVVPLISRLLTDPGAGSDLD